MLQFLIDNGCMDAVRWIAEERGAPLQGLDVGYGDAVLAGCHLSVREKLRCLQEEQRRAWVGSVAVGGGEE